MTPKIFAYLLTQLVPAVCFLPEAPAMCSFPEAIHKNENRCLSEYLILFNKRLMNAC